MKVIIQWRHLKFWQINYKFQFYKLGFKSRKVNHYFPLYFILFLSIFLLFYYIPLYIIHFSIYIDISPIYGLYLYISCIYAQNILFCSVFPIYTPIFYNFVVDKWVCCVYTTPFLFYEWPLYIHPYYSVFCRYFDWKPPNYPALTLYTCIIESYTVQQYEVLYEVQCVVLSSTEYQTTQQSVRSTYYSVVRTERSSVVRSIQSTTVQYEGVRSTPQYWTYSTTVRSTGVYTAQQSETTQRNSRR